MKYIFRILLVLSTFVHAQKLEYISEFGNFSSASSFDTDLNGNFFVTDILENTVTKIDSNGKTIISIGGYGWSESTFDEPFNIVTNTLSVYVSDKNNDRLQRFDKDLNFLSQYSGRESNSEIDFAYPTELEISKTGDLLVLDTDNNRILKFSLTGEFLLEIGSNDAGTHALNNPIDFSIDENENIFVLDNNKIKVFDLYGNGQFSYDLLSNPKKIYCKESVIFYLEDFKITGFDLNQRKVIYNFYEIKNLDKSEIIDLKIVDSLLFILSPTKILKYKICEN